MCVFLFQTTQPAPKPDILNERGTKNTPGAIGFLLLPEPCRKRLPNPSRTIYFGARPCPDDGAPNWYFARSIHQKLHVSESARSHMARPHIGVLREALINNQVVPGLAWGRVWQGLKLVFSMKHSSTRPVKTCSL